MIRMFTKRTPLHPTNSKNCFSRPLRDHPRKVLASRGSTRSIQPFDQSPGVGGYRTDLVNGQIPGQVNPRPKLASPNLQPLVALARSQDNKQPTHPANE